MTRPQEIRKEVLQLLYATRPLNMSAAVMERRTRKWGNDYTSEEMAREAEFLVGQGLVRKEHNAVSAETVFTITSAGIIAFEG